MIDTVEKLIADMQRPVPDRLMKKSWVQQHVNCYEGSKGGYYTTYSGQTVARETVLKALKLGVLVPEWPDKPHLAYWKLNHAN